MGKKASKPDPRNNSNRSESQPKGEYPVDAYTGEPEPLAVEHLLQGGRGAGVSRIVVEHQSMPVEMVGIHDTYAESGKPQELLFKYGLMPEDIVAAARNAIARK